MTGYGAALYFLFPLICHLSAAEPSGGKRCYSCTSYMSQCKGVVDDSHNDVFKAMCTSKCFVRMGEDGALYRGCFDGFVEVRHLNQGYNNECRNQTWNGKTLPWCMCDDDLCNGDSMNMGEFYNIDAYSYTSTLYDDDNTVYVESSKYDDGLDTYTYNNADGSSNQDTTYRSDASANQDASYRYDDNQDAGYEFDSRNSANKDQTSMNKFAREGPNDPMYDETLFGLNDFNTKSPYGGQYRTTDYRTPYPNEHKGNYYNQDLPGAPYASINAGGQELYYPRPQLKQEQHYPYDGQYSRESGPEYNYNQRTYQEPQVPEERGSNYVTSRLAAKIRCSKSGYYQNPNDCRQFIACLMDPYSRTPVMHLMKCPEGLVWDNIKKICMQYSTTCNVAVSSQMDDDVGYDVTNKVDVTGFNTNTVQDGYYGNGAADDGGDTGNAIRATGDDNNYDMGYSQNGKKYQDVQDIVF